MNISLDSAPPPSRQAGCSDLFKLQLAALVPMLLLHPGRLFAASPPLTVFRVVFAVAGGVATLLVNYWILYGAIRVVASREKRGVTTNLGFVTFLDVTVSILVAVFIYCVFAKKLHLWP